MASYNLVSTFSVILIVFHLSIGDSTTSPEFLDFIESWQKATFSIRGNEEMWSQYVEYHKQIWENSRVNDIPFTCETDLSDSPPTSVHQLRPGDVQVIAAVGDSLTAASALDASSLAGTLIAFRGESWTMGGDFSLDEGVITLPNILRKFNPNLKGFSKCIRFRGHADTWFNVAVPGSFAFNMPNQADILIERMKSDARIDFQSDWKIINFLIGGNDLCRYCIRRSQGRFTPEQYITNIQTALDKFHQHVPKALINLIQMGDVSLIRNISDLNPWCYNFHRIACNCALRSPELLRQIQIEYNAKIDDLIASGRYDTREDFTVVVQPHMKDAPLPIDTETGKIDGSVYAPDCFHPNRKGHQEMAFALWNVMMTRVEDKPTNSVTDTNGAYKCPTKEYPYIFTHQNSDPVTTQPPASGSGVSLARSGSIFLPLLLVFLALSAK